MNRMDMDKWYPIFKNYTVAVEITDVVSERFNPLTAGAAYFRVFIFY